MPESDCPGSFQLPLAWAYNLTGDFCHFFCLDKRHFITEFVGVAIYETDRANNRILQADPGL